METMLIMILVMKPILSLISEDGRNADHDFTVMKPNRANAANMLAWRLIG